MALGTYNGHSGAKREKVQRLVTAKWATGEWPRPERCVACGQTAGTIHGHHEDYDQPREYVPLCITCHLLVHCRFRNAGVWEEYRARVRRGWRAPALDQRSAFGALQRTILRGEWPEGEWVNEPRWETWLDTGLLHEVRLTVV